MSAAYILTTFSPAMFGEKATSHMRVLPIDEASTWITANTKIVSSKVSHERLAKRLFPAAAEELQRYAQLAPGKSAILINYRGPPVSDAGDIPSTGSVTLYLIEVEEYQES